MRAAARGSKHESATVDFSIAYTTTTMISTESRSTEQRKRQRLDQLVDRIAHFVSSSSSGPHASGRVTTTTATTPTSPTPVCEGIVMESDRDLRAVQQQQQLQQLQQHHYNLMSRLRMTQRVPFNRQVFSFDHVPAMTSADHSEDEGEEEVFSPVSLATFSDRLTLSPCSTVESPSAISFSPLSLYDESDVAKALAAGRSLLNHSDTSSNSTPLNLSKSSRCTAPSPPFTSSPFDSPPSVFLTSPATAAATEDKQSPRDSTATAASRRRARSDSDLSHSMTCLDYRPAETAWVVTPADVLALQQQQQQHEQQQQQKHMRAHRLSRLSRLEHLRPPPLVVSLKRSSTDSSTDSWSPLLQESPVDLSVRSGSSSFGSSSDSPNLMSSSSGSGSGGVGDYLETPRFCSVSRATAKLLTRSLSLSQYLTAEYSPDQSVEDVSPSSHSPMAPPALCSTTTTTTTTTTTKGAFVCDVCGQAFDLHDRLVKHLASRHKSRKNNNNNKNISSSSSPTSNGTNSASDSSVVKGYQCQVCQRPFARSDMLTRHMRLHTGSKPYTCRICGQVFSRSDHLSTHQRTHTGEKPYRCPQCSYAACRRDMITRHLRTHTRSEDLDAVGNDCV